MDKRIVLLAVIVGIVASGVFGAGTPDSSEQPKIIEEVTGSGGAQLLNFTTIEDAAALAEQGAVVLFFHASWCPTCRSATRDIIANRGILTEEVNIVWIDYDNNSALKQNYGVTYQHTFVQIDSAGEIVEIWNGGNSSEITRRIRL